MSRKHNTKHSRRRSNYPERLKNRGLAKAPQMTPFDTPGARMALRARTGGPTGGEE